MFAGKVRARQVEIEPQEIDEVTADGNGSGNLLAIDRQGNFGGFFSHTPILALAATEGKIPAQQYLRHPACRDSGPFHGFENVDELCPV